MQPRAHENGPKCTSSELFLPKRREFNSEGTDGERQGQQLMAARKFGARGAGADMNPERIQEAEANARRAGFFGRVRFIQNVFGIDGQDIDWYHGSVWPCRGRR